jgi:DNA-binding GntR family transcriptional regulator
MKAKTKNLKESAYKSIKEKIIRGELKPGDTILEDELQDELGVSRTPIREALIRLQSENFVVIYPRKGIFVSILTPKTIREIYEVRELVEPQLLRKIFHSIDRKWLADMKVRFSEDLSHLSKEEKKNHFVELDEEFHNYFLNLSENNYLVEMLNRVYDQIHRMRIHTFYAELRSEMTREEHIRIIDAILDNDIERAVNRMYEHIILSREVSINNIIV